MKKQQVRAEQRAVWQRPAVQRLRAGDAEQFTRESVADGGFTNS